MFVGSQQKKREKIIIMYYSIICESTAATMILVHESQHVIYNSHIYNQFTLIYLVSKQMCCDCERIHPSVRL